MGEQANICSELVVIGGGPSGYSAAFMAADHGKKVTLVEEDKLGGVCLNRGCIPSKALLRHAGLLREAAAAKECGLVFDGLHFEREKLAQWKEKVVARLSDGVSALAKARGVNVVCGKASFDGPSRLIVCKALGETVTIDFEQAILATGSSPVMPAEFGHGDSRVMDSTAALQLQDVPPRLLVVGGGYIGVEMAFIYSAFGSRVTLVEMADGLLLGADRDLVRPVQQKMASELEAIHLKTKVEKIEALPDGMHVSLVGEKFSGNAVFDKIIVAVGRRPNSTGLGLEKAGANIAARGFVETDAQRRTSNPRIFAIGDVAGEPMLAHKGSHDARVAVEAILGKQKNQHAPVIPFVVFSDPEIAWCGLTESAAASENRAVSVTRFPWAASGRAQTMDRSEGSTKIIMDSSSGKVLGVGMVGAHAGEMIGEGALAVKIGMKADEWAECVHAHPTLSETWMEAAESLNGNATHWFRKRNR